MKNITKLLICFAIFTMILMCSSCFAAWWGTPGYEWALSNGLTPIKTRAQLNREVTLNDYYNIILKYLKMKNVRPTGRMVQNLYVGDIYNGAIYGLVEDINTYIGTNVKELTPQQYRVVEDLITHGKKQIVEFSEYLYRDDLKGIDLYFDLARYRAATLLSENKRIEREYKNSVLYSLRNTKYASSLDYGIMPMSDYDVARQSFLVLMHHILANSSASTDAIINSFYDTGVLIGYDDSLWLRKGITYSELFAFLYRFEAYDFTASLWMDQ